VQNNNHLKIEGNCVTVTKATAMQPPGHYYYQSPENRLEVRKNKETAFLQFRTQIQITYHFILAISPRLKNKLKKL